MVNEETKSEEPETLEGIIKSVSMSNNSMNVNENRDLFVLIDRNGTLVNTVLRCHIEAYKYHDPIAIQQLSANLRLGSKVRIKVKRDKKYTEALPLYSVVSEDQILNGS